MTKQTKTCDASAVLYEILFPENLEGFSPSRQIHRFDLAKDAECRRRLPIQRSFPISLHSKGLPPSTPLAPLLQKTHGFFSHSSASQTTLEFSSQTNPPSEVVGFPTLRSTSIAGMEMEEWPAFSRLDGYKLHQKGELRVPNQRRTTNQA